MPGVPWTVVVVDGGGFVRRDCWESRVLPEWKVLIGIACPVDVAADKLEQAAARDASFFFLRIFRLCTGKVSESSGSESR